MSDEQHDQQPRREEPGPATARDYLAPDTLDVGTDQTRAKFITALVVAGAIVACGTLAGVRFTQAQRAQAATIATPAPDAPQPAGNLTASQPLETSTPFPTQTVPPGVSLVTLTPQQLAQQQANEAAAAQAATAQSRAEQTVPAAAPVSTPTPYVPHPGVMSGSDDQQTDATQTSANAPQDPSGRQSGGVRNAQTLAADQHGEFMGNANRENGVGYVAQISRDQLLPTTVIPARLLTAINSDLPGPVSATVTQPVYDSTTHSRVVIPQGAFLYGTYDSHVISGQNRLLIAWTEIIFPNGADFRMGAQPGTDAEGRSGFSGHVDNHDGEVYQSAFLMSVLGVGEALLAPPPQSVLQQPGVGTIAAQSVGGQLAQVGNQIINRKVQRPPTITIEPPYSFEVFITRPLPLQAYRV